MRKYFKNAKTLGLFWDSSVQYNVVFKGVDAGDPAVQAGAVAVLGALADGGTAHSMGPSDWWLADFVAWAPTQPGLAPYVTPEGFVDGASSATAKRAFADGVGDFLATSPFGRYETAVALREDGSVRASKASLYHFNMAGTLRKIAAMTAAYDTCADSDLGIKHAVPYSETYIFVTQFMVIVRETVGNMICSFAAVALISWPVLQSARCVAVILVCVAAIDVDLLGLLWVWGLDLNSITMISLVMAIGLVVDYLAHILHYFHEHSKNNPDDPRSSMAAALDEVGGAVLLGVSTTFVGVLPLAFASSFIYRVFFKLFLGIISLGMVHGFVVVPCMVILFPPRHGTRASSPRACGSTVGDSGSAL